MNKKTKRSWMFLWVSAVFSFAQGAGAQEMKMEIIDLPSPRLRGAVTVEETLHKRRSVRSFQETPLSLAEVSQLVWAAQGITAPATGFRTAPSAGATYPLEVYVVAGNVQGLPPGLYRYRPEKHTLARAFAGDLRGRLADMALGQDPIRQAPLTFLIAAVYRRTALRYGSRAERYVQMEAGHVAQNIALQAVAMGLGSVMIGAFNDSEVKRICRLPPEEEPLYLIPVGRPSR